MFNFDLKFNTIVTPKPELGSMLILFLRNIKAI